MTPVQENPKNKDDLYAALVARDARFDGVFFVGVTTTGIYCRPVCVARTPGRERCRFFRAAVDAEHAGFRACFRCRPELAPGAGAPVDAVSRLVAGALARVEAGFLNDNGVVALAAALGVTDRHLRRAVEDELGVSLVELAQSRRLATARRLVMDTALPLSHVAHASGFRSLRRFNALFATRFGRAPSSLRRRAPAGARRANDGELLVRLPFRPPYDWAALLAFLRGRAVPGVEVVGDDAYLRTVRAGDTVGCLRVTRDRVGHALRAAISPALGGQLMAIVTRLRALFDLDARPDLIRARFEGDPLLGPAVRRTDGLRLPGAFDPFEATVRAILGQQISVRAATTLAGRLVARFGARLPDAAPEAPALTHLFPRAHEIAAASIDALASIGLPGARAATLQAVAALFDTPALDQAVQAGDRAEIERRLRTIPGIGDWTAAYVSMRALHDPDAFPAGDLGVRSALGGLAPRAAEARAEAWRPWRSYAVMHLWATLGAPSAPVAKERKESEP